MSQTIGGHFLGAWYDTVGWCVVAAISFYFALFANRLSLAQKRLLPALILNRGLCLLAGVLFVVLALYTSVVSHDLAPSSKASAPQASWKEIHSNGKGDSISIDTASLSRQGRFTNYWSKVSFKMPRTVGPSAEASHFFDNYIANCEEKTFSHVSSYSLSADGRPVSHKRSSEAERTFVEFPADPAHPDTILLKFICAK